MNSIFVVRNTDGDYEALYLNDIQVISGTSIPRHDLVDTMEKNTPHNYDEYCVKADWLEDEGGMYPNKFSEIPEEAFDKD